VSSSITQLSELLDRRREDLHALESVIGTGVGVRGQGPGNDDAAIQVFVRSPDDVAEVARNAAVLLGEVPLEVIVSGEATAVANEQGERNG